MTEPRNYSGKQRQSMDSRKPSRHSKQSSPSALQERRRAERIVPETESKIAFCHQGQEYIGVVENLSHTGVAIQLDAFEHNLYLVPGTPLQLTMCFADEKECRKCQVVWARIRNGVYCIGAESLAVMDNAAGGSQINLDQVKIDPSLAMRVPPSLAMRRNLLPFALYDGHVHVACCNKQDASMLRALERMVQAPVRTEVVDPDSLKRALQRVYCSPQANALAQGESLRTRSVDLRSLSELEPDDAVSICDELLHAAILRQASDIHLDPEPGGVKVRFRADGVLEEYRHLPGTVQAGLISRFKVMSGMDIAEKRAPQDGGFKQVYGSGGQSVDIRVATLPTKHGERMTLRLLALQTESLTLEKLGMCQRDLACFEAAIDKPHGMILLTGPTGSGKSTTLYAAIRRLIAQENVNVITVEDPIEYDIADVAQVEVDSADKVTFHKALRSLLRHDPDVVMIGEIRDIETAGVAIKAALTGHLVFSTLHTNNAVGVITRLADIGLERYLIGASLRLAVAQRLVRRLCSHCREPHEVTIAEAKAMYRPALEGEQIWKPKGCIYCGDVGYSGRIGLFELLPVEEHLARRIADHAEEPELLEYSRQQKYATLMDDAVDKLRAGLTSVREVLTAVTIW